MAYEIEDEVDWSDGPLEPPSPEDVKPPVDPSSLGPSPEVGHDENLVSLSDTYGEYNVPHGLPLKTSMAFLDVENTLLTTSSTS
jgi:hypothetical protein